MNYCAKLSGFNLYHTGHIRNGLYRDCLYYPTPKKGLVHQLIEYCIRSELEEYVLNNKNIDSTFTFNDLRMQNITSDVLYEWSAPMDLIENYQIYLENHSVPSTFSFHNCTFPWFGTYCEYRFEKAELSFSEQVVTYFETDTNIYSLRYNISCYTYLECDRKGDHGQTSGVCLDWREVCDGKVDCLNGGKDEEQFWELEMNECDIEIEFRCRNGQCIPRDFLNDDEFNPDCLDRSDENYNTQTMRGYLRTCYKQPDFRCEEHMISQREYDKPIIECGDGTWIILFQDICENYRNTKLAKAFIQGINASEDCRHTISCLMVGSHFAIPPDGMCYFEFLSDYASELKEYCPSLIELPPLLFGHKKLNFSNTANWYLPPDYICYNETLCDKDLLPTKEPDIIDLVDNNRTCRSFDDFNIHYTGKISWHYLIHRLHHIFYKCSRYYQPLSIVGHSNLYQCINSSKIISRHSLADNIQDCLHGDDEYYNESCSLNSSKDRFKCSLNNTTVCLAPIRILDGNTDCTDGSDEIPSVALDLKSTISFQTTCDGHIELSSMLIDGRNETDETECDYFPCNNTYTRCDGHWNCIDGADEINCEWPSICPSLEHLCISPITGNISCLPIKHINDGTPNCVGATDERTYCHQACTNSTCRLSWCWNNTLYDELSGPHGLNECIGVHNVSKQYCAYARVILRKYCQTTKIYNHMEQILCYLEMRTKPSRKYLSITVTDSLYPSVSFTSNETKQVLPLSTNLITSNKITSHTSMKDQTEVTYCNRGIVIRRLIHNTNKTQPICLCPPAYHGRRCEIQSQRISLTIQLQPFSDFRTVFTVIIKLMDDEQGLIESYDQFNYISMYDCTKKYDIYLLYKTRPKNQSMKYTVRIDLHEKISFEFRGSWSFPIQFLFLPVYRMAVQLHIPFTKPILTIHKTERCNNHGHYLEYVNINTTFCYCDKGWTGLYCDIQYESNCSPDSYSLGPNLCLCPLEKFGPRCYVKRPKCFCKNGGFCVWNDERISQHNRSWCICPDGFSGVMCELRDTKILISFASNVEIPSSILFHFIEVHGKRKHHNHTTIFKKIALDQSSIEIYRNNPFHILFIEIEPKTYYLSVLNANYQPSSNITSVLTKSKECLPIDKLFNATIVATHVLRRIKLYHIPCQQRTDLNCFYDDIHMCICNHDFQQTNCFRFNHTMIYNCKRRSPCENHGRCFYDKSSCPTSLMCVCDDCSYGSRCQFSTKGFAISLDVILSYQIKPNVSFNEQRLSIKITTAIVTIMFVFGLVSNILAIITFQTKNAREVGCGYYLLISSCISIVVFILFALKFYFLILAQMNVITNRNFLSLNCILIDFLVKVLVNISNWLNACVGIERIIAAYQKHKINKSKTVKIAKWIIIVICILNITTNLHEPIYRRLIDDEQENRTWCIVKYSSSVQIFNSFILLFHFLCPFIMNITSAFLIVFKVAYHRFTTQQEKSYGKQLRQEFYQLKHLFISPFILIILALPQLVISFLSGCMKSPRNPWLFLFGYLISFVPSILIFVVFVIPSEQYKKEFKATITRIRKYNFNR